jgi:hypothetical protein
MEDKKVRHRNVWPVHLLPLYNLCASAALDSRRIWVIVISLAFLYLAGCGPATGESATQISEPSPVTTVTGRNISESRRLSHLSEPMVAEMALPAFPGDKVVTFEAIPVEEKEILNPARGYFQHYTETVHPDAADFFDRYFRFNWIDLEPEEGVYDFSLIAEQLNRLEQGQKLGLRLMTLNSSARQDTIPDYIRSSVNGTPCGGPGRWVPDWDNRLFQERVEQLFTEFIRWLVADHDRLQKIWHIDSGLYGNFGEGHLFPFDRDNCVSIPPLDVRAWYYEMQWQVMQRYAPQLRFTANSFGAQEDLFERVMALSPKIGIRTDSLNAQNGWFDNQWLNYPGKLRIVGERWKTAPHYVEYIERYPSSLVDSRFENALTSVRRWNIAGVANNGFNRDFSGMSDSALQNARLVGRLAGYRFILRGVSYPEVIRTGDPLVITSAWSNTGTTPLYEPFEVVFELHNNDNLVWRGSSEKDLELFLPTAEGDKDNPVLVEDNFTFNDIAPGTYELSVIVIDPDGYRFPLQLANEGRNDRGGYTIGRVIIE